MMIKTNTIRKYILKLLCILPVIVLITCGDAVLEEVTGFDPNPGPIYQRIDIKYQDNTTFTPGANILPKMLLNITAEVTGDIVDFTYSAEIPGATDTGSFNNKLITHSSGNTYIGTTTYALPDTLPQNSTVSILITVEDIKGAFSTRNILLGPVKPNFDINEVSVTRDGSAVTVEWEADADGLFQFYVLSPPLPTPNPVANCNYCIKDLGLSAQVFKYFTGSSKFTSSNYTSVNDIFCIVIFDDLDQYNCLEYTISGIPLNP